MTDTSWGAAIDNAAHTNVQGAALEHAFRDGAGLEDGHLMASGLKNASKCRECQKTIDIGTAAWFNKEGEPGRKITCQECHTLKVGDSQANPDAPAEGEKGPRTVKKRKLAPKLTDELLLDREKGITAVFVNFPKIKFKGKGSEAADLRRLMHKYAEWAGVLLPDMAFSDFVERFEKLSGNHRLRTKLELIRNVQQGLCNLEDIDDYELADKEVALADGGFGADDDDWAPVEAAPVEVTEEMRSRMAANKAAALAKAAARKEAAAAAEMMEMMGGCGGGEGEDEGFHSDDEAAFGDFDDDVEEAVEREARAARAKAAEAAAEAAEEAAMEAAIEAAEAAALADAGGEAEAEAEAAPPSGAGPGADAAAAAARAEAEALEAGFDEEDAEEPAAPGSGDAEAWGSGLL